MVDKIVKIKKSDSSNSVKVDSRVEEMTAKDLSSVNHSRNSETVAENKQYKPESWYMTEEITADELAHGYSESLDESKQLKIGRWYMDSHLVSLLEPDSVEVEYYRRLRYTIESLTQKSGKCVIAVTSPTAEDGKTLTSINLAGVLAQNKQAKVLLIELDLRHPRKSISDYLGIRKKVNAGIVDSIQDQRDRLDEVIYSLSDFNLHILPAGSYTDSPYEILKSPVLDRIIEKARQKYDFVIIDTAPVALLTDSQLISRCVDGYLMVVAAGKTPRNMLEEALDQMDPNKVLGLIFNGFTPLTRKNYGYYG